MPEAERKPHVGERIMAVINRDPRTAPNATRNDILLALASTAYAVVVALTTDPVRRPDTVGWILLLTAQALVVWRRRHPLPVLVGVAAMLLLYHALDNNHTAPLPVSVIAVYTVAVTCRPLYTVLASGTGLSLALTIMMIVNKHRAAEALRTSGWVIAVVFIGIALRFYRQYVAAVVERAERAERTREEEARRRVAEERLRIARDLHDLLAHSITLIGVQTSVAAHVLNADPERLDREAVAKSLDDISETCRTARGELRTTLEVLREHGSLDARDPLPDLHGLQDLAEAARVSGAQVDLTVTTDEVPPAVGAAAYRIVQEALTNAVRHGGRQNLGIRVGVRAGEGALRVTVTDDGIGTGGGKPGFGLVGMRERARSVGGTLDAGPLPGKGFEVSAVLPLGGNP
ncbi:sensor histidine kinase [Streptomyces sp. enrichment culture]|uniref:sensor histidine kinase n=1 Tax=Streptomyces sp. enrichment culture TaxID=1795815 RepID=UPI003F56E1E9